jgi:putative nucleotidyltransferase with HDIG domain
MAAATVSNILFVDDDPLILSGLQRMLRPMRHEWTMHFVESGAKALAALETTTFHVVVSDMRMPGMNGAQLLSEVKRRHPETVRLILSGHADRELILQCVGTAHQFLAKPSEPEAIRAAISRATAFNASVKSEQIRKLVVQMDRLPSIPSVYTEIVEKLRHEGTTVEEIGDLITRDLALTAKLLKLVNSAFFGLNRQIAHPAEATAYLGFDTIKDLVLGVNAFSSFEGGNISGLSLESLWEHSMHVAAAARRIMQSEEVGSVFAEEAFVSGMLHDIGKLILAVNAPENYRNALKLAPAEQISLAEAEVRIFGANHADVGGFVLSLWGLPVRVVEAITYHHEPESAGTTSLNPLVAVHVANHAVSLKNRAHEQPVSRLSSDFLASLSLHQKVPDWINFAHDNE